MKRIKHNDLTHYFIREHSTLPGAYLASCEEFFKWLKDCKETGFKAASPKLQAPSNKPRPALMMPQLNSIMKTERKKYENN